MAGLLIDREAALVAFLRRAAREPHRNGQWDCSMFLANWFQEITGRDPVVHFRGQYNDRAGWQAIIERAGGLVSLIDDVAVRVGIARTQIPELGDIGVIDLPRLGHTGAILAMSGWALKLNDGLSIVPGKPVAAWKLPAA